MPERKITYTDNDRAIVAALKGSEGMTLAELCESTGRSLVSGHIVGAMKKGLIAVVGEKEVIRKGKKALTVYSYVDSDVHSNGDKPFNYTDNEKALLEAASRIDSPFLLSDLAAAMGVEKLSSGSINGLVKKGNISKDAEKRIVETDRPDTVKVYGFVADIPADAE